MMNVLTQKNIVSAACPAVLTCVFAVIPNLVVAQQFRAPQSRAKDGAVLGGIAGAILGGIAGHQNDETPEGIALGGAVGVIAGGLMGRADERMQVEQQIYQQQQQQAYQQRMGRAVSLQDAISMSQSGLSPNLIINQINDNGVTHRLAVSDIIYLHQNGVSEAVIDAMQEARLASHPDIASRVNLVSPPVVSYHETIVVPPAPSVGRIHIYPHPRVYHPRSGIYFQHHFQR